VPCVENTAGFARGNQQIIRGCLWRSVSEMCHLKFSGKEGGNGAQGIIKCLSHELPGRTKNNYGKSQLIEIVIKFLRKE
jgi:hypothetical protein